MQRTSSSYRIKKDSLIDAELLKRSRSTNDSFDLDIDYLNPDDVDTDEEEFLQCADEIFDAETLMAGFYSIRTSRYTKGTCRQRTPEARLPALLQSARATDPRFEIPYDSH
jgi:hypothetical protein